MKRSRFTVHSSRKERCIALWVLLVPALIAASAGEEIITAGALLEQVRILASPEMTGRGVGTPGIREAANHITREFQEVGLKPGGTQGYRQTFEVVTAVRVGETTRMHVVPDGSNPDGSQTIPESQFTPFGFSDDGTVEGEVVFAGYGITAPELHYDDYAGVDVKDKIVLVLTHEPREKDEKSPFRNPDAYRYTEVRYKAINAREHGAKAIVIVEDALGHQGEPEELFAIRGVAGGSRAGIVAINAKRSVAEDLLRTTGKTLAHLQQEIDRALKPRTLALSRTRVTIQVELIEKRGTTANIVGVLPGSDPVLRESVIVIGAHYDHLGLGGEYSLAPARYGEIHHGADDNASGTAGLILLARAFARRGGTKRTLVFVAFSAEELGIVGSSYYAKSPPIPLQRTVAMVNLDMIGRLKDRNLYVFGVKTGKEFADLLDSVNRDHHLILKRGADGYGPSDHTSFYTHRVPVLFFFTGPHADYHRPSDTVDKINGEGLADVTRLVYGVIERLANRPEPVTYVRVKEAPPTPTGRGYGAYFGSIPDFAYEEGKGVRLSGVRPESPAEKAGLQEGDIIVKMAGVRIMNLRDLVFILRSKRAGDKVEVVFFRDGQEIRSTTTLGRRR